MFNAIKTNPPYEELPFCKVHRIVGIYASADDLISLGSFFSKLPDKVGITFVIIQPPTEINQLTVETISKLTSLPVVLAQNHMTVNTDTVYVIQSEQPLTIHTGCFVLSDFDAQAEFHCADYFFTTLARVVGERSIALFFSGCTVDGALGALAIREKGGIVMLLDNGRITLDPLHKWFLDNNAADFVLSAPLLADELIRLSKLLVDASDLSLDLESFKKIYLTLKLATGIDFTLYKHNIVANAVKRHLSVVGFTKLTDYADFLSKQSSEVLNLSREILIGITSFFRDIQAFETLKSSALRHIIRNTPSESHIRIWSAGCSTGEEAYSVAILIDELIQEIGQKRNIKIFATDVNVQAISKASHGEFDENIINTVSSERLQKYFTLIDGKYRINDRIRKMITFAPHDLLRDPPFRKIDLLLCRNVLIYFQEKEQNAILSIFNTALKPGGYLFLGRNENATEYASVFKAISISEKIYAHVALEKQASEESLCAFRLGNPLFQVPIGNTLSDQDQTVSFFNHTYTQFLERFLPASVIVDSNNNIIHFFGSINDYLTITPGIPSFNLFNLLNKDVKLAVSTAINHSRNNHLSVSYTDIKISSNEGDRLITVSAYPVSDSYNKQELIAVIFTECNSNQAFVKGEKFNINAAVSRRIEDLELELLNNRKRTETIIRELQTANEDLQASNEELQTSNEELHSFNLALQSSKEELRMILLQHEEKYIELSQRDDKFSECLVAAETGILIADMQYNICYFSKFLAREFNLFDHDVGRSIQIFTLAFPNDDLMADVREVLQDCKPRERQVVTHNGQMYRIRIACHYEPTNQLKEIVVVVVKLSTQQSVVS